MKFDPYYLINPKIAQCLMRIEAVKAKILQAPLTVRVLTSLRETARLASTHYSTKIEGNQLDFSQVEKVILQEKTFKGKVRDEAEIKGYYAALTRVEELAYSGKSLTEELVQQLHALVMGEKGTKKRGRVLYRDGQNAIYEGHTRRIVYLPPEAGDVSLLMAGLIQWICANKVLLPCPLLAAIAHYQYVTIHPYYDGNGRTARLLTTFVLYQGGYDLKGLYSLEEYYAQNLDAYYVALNRGPSHNYYFGRAEADITPWIEYFVEGMAVACENILKRMVVEASLGKEDHEILLRKLDPKQRRALELFRDFETVTAHQIGELFGFKPRTSAQLCKDWVEVGFIEVVNASNRNRCYKIGEAFEPLIAK
ncbi:MAG: hypothetical protein UV38_C0002G0275 [candidate division TM6 bacterium GW2011_GWE2_42_60]|nr:MAG: hypothetical protein UV38_C0002G0275 [candidate division TM6 bacterium GW2011_GWE2_42_60]